MIDNIIRIMNIDEAISDIQRIQTEHRLKLIDSWNIEKGSRILEIGCGQGDTLVALAYVVGENGFVHGVDIADENYGEPETLGQARNRLLQGELGKNIQINLNFDVMDEKVSFLENEFDYIVLSHCLWYLSDYQTLVEILRRIKPWSKQLCIAEWNPCIDRPEQLSHLKAINIQAVCESFKETSQSNVRTMFYPHQIEQAVRESGWITQKTANVYSPDMQDGSWEVWTTIGLYPNEIESIADMPNKLKQLLLAQIEEIKQVESTHPMSTHCLKAIKEV